VLKALVENSALGGHVEWRGSGGGSACPRAGALGKALAEPGGSGTRGPWGPLAAGGDQTCQRPGSITSPDYTANCFSCDTWGLRGTFDSYWCPSCIRYSYD